ncbi:MAG: hypothetical protein JWN43_1515, partial [Gammaproteobacteria bacterium]|nr:hypothetical protein [Gammaproteobacteria bacterium]
MRRNQRVTLFVVSLVLAAVLAFVALRHYRAAKVEPVSKGTPSYWYDPMHPGEHFDKPGPSPFMNMPLVPKYSEEGPTQGGANSAPGAPPGSIAVDSRAVQNLGLRIAKVERGSFGRVVDTVGLVGVDEHRIEAI